MSTFARQSSQAVKKKVRETYVKSVKSLTDQNRQKLNLQKIMAINFGQDALIIISKRKLLIYSILTLKVFYVRQGIFWDAVFIPNSALVALVEHDGTSKSRRTLRILDLQKDSIIAAITISFQIQQIKASQNCICLAGTKQICVMHFPSLKPICHQYAGSGIKVIFDMSAQGLTLAYQNQKKGFVTVRNFSGVQTLKARRKSQQNKFQRNKSSFLGSFHYPPQNNPKRMVQIKAHNQYVSLIRLSPNGTRVATASHKGTMIRIFLTQNGKLWEQLRVGYQICKILDICFYEEGNFISCVNERSMVYLFNLKLQVQQEQAETQKRGYKIYQQDNPKSMFSFLSFIYSNFGNEHPFAYFQLVKPQEDESEQGKQKSLKQSTANKAENYQPLLLKNMTSTSSLNEIKEQKSMQIISEQSSQYQQKIQPKQQQKIQKITRSLNEVQNQKQKKNEKDSIKLERTASIAYSQTPSKRGKSLLKKFNLNHTKKQNYDYIGKVYNTISRIFIGGDNFIWAIRGSYIFTLKYDPFNGGQMYYKEALKFC